MPIFNTYIGDDSTTSGSNSPSELEDRRLRRNIQWGVVRGMLLYSLFMIPVALVAVLLISVMR
jgi:hypothetical protein